MSKKHRDYEVEDVDVDMAPTTDAQPAPQAVSPAELLDKLKADLAAAEDQAHVLGILRASQQALLESLVAGAGPV